MKLRKINYREFYEDPKHNAWELNDLILGNLNLLVGTNSTGKTRTINIITSLAKVINDQIGFDSGEWKVEFLTINDKKFLYELTFLNKKIIREKIFLDQEMKLDRSPKITKIKSETNGYIEIQPPDDKLVLHVRRDKKEHPFFEDLCEWAANTYGYKFGSFSPEAIMIPSSSKDLLQSLSTAPSVLDALSKDSLKKVIENINKIGYEVENAKADIAGGIPFNFKMIYIQEKGLKHLLQQPHISSGMLRTFALFVVIQYLLAKNGQQNMTILVDDLGEGLDYERSIKLAQLIFNQLNKKNIQFISTTNDRFMMNAVDIENWNVLRRNVGKVSALNYENSKEKFDNFKFTGLSNADLFASDYLANEK